MTELHKEGEKEGGNWIDLLEIHRGSSAMTSYALPFPNYYENEGSTLPPFDESWNKSKLADFLFKRAKPLCFPLSLLWKLVKLYCNKNKFVFSTIFLRLRKKIVKLSCYFSKNVKKIVIFTRIFKVSVKIVKWLPFVNVFHIKHCFSRDFFSQYRNL